MLMYIISVTAAAGLVLRGEVSGATFSYQGCVRVEAYITLSITYQDKNNKTVISDPVPITDDSVAFYGQCYSPRQADSYPHVGIPTGYPDDSVIRSVSFDFKNTKDVVSMSMSVVYDLSRLPGFSGAQTKLVVADSKWMEVSNINNSYLCTTPMSMSMGDKVVASVNKIHAQAYHMKSGEFSKTTDGCSEFSTPSTTPSSTTDAPKRIILPIVVGLAPPTITVIALLGYFCGRRRGRNEERMGYQTL